MISNGNGNCLRNNLKIQTLKTKDLNGLSPLHYARNSNCNSVYFLCFILRQHHLIKYSDMKLVRTHSPFFRSSILLHYTPCLSDCARCSCFVYVSLCVFVSVCEIYKYCFGICLIERVQRPINKK